MTKKAVKYLKITLIAVLALALSLLLAACGEPEKGDKGDKGDDGVGIVSVEKIATNGNVDTYRITLSNGDTTEFTVTNGTDGADGATGADGKSAYELYKQYFGYDGSEKQWLKDLVNGKLTVEETFVITFDAQNGEELFSVSAEEGIAVNLPIPENGGRAFDGWYIGDEKVYSPYIATSDVTLVAKWKELNPDNEYNYYASRYAIEGEVKILPVTFLGVEKIFITEGDFLLYIDSEDVGADERFQVINTLAQEWNVTIHHFNPDLTGGFAAENTNAVEANIIKEFTDDTAKNSQLVDVQNYLTTISNKEATTFADHSLLAVRGREPTYWVDNGDSLDVTVQYNGRIAAENDYTAAVRSIMAIALRKPSYASNASSSSSENPAAYNTSNIDVMNIYADSRFHMYDDNYTAEKTDVYQTIANYQQFAWLLDNNDGKFAVLYGGIWCPNTQAIAKLTNDLARDYGIEKVYIFNHRLDDCIKLNVYAAYNNNGSIEVSVTKNAAFLAVSLLTRSGDGDYAGQFNWNYLYAQFLDSYLPDFESGWNNGVYYNITSNGETSQYTRICSPAVMLFDGSGFGKANLVGVVEAEYTYDQIYGGNSVAKDMWTEAIKELFDKNEYAAYNPDAGGC